MDIRRPSNARAKTIRRTVLVTVAVLLLGGVTLGLSRLRPAAPAVDRATAWTDEVKCGSMLREMRGLGELPAQTDSRVDRIVLRPGAIVKPDSVRLELSDPQLQRDALDARHQLKGAQADHANLKVQVNSELMNQKALEASVRSDYEQAKIQHEVDDKLHAEGIGADVTAKLSKVEDGQLAIRMQLESERTKNPSVQNGTVTVDVTIDDPLPLGARGFKRGHRGNRKPERQSLCRPSRPRSV